MVLKKGFLRANIGKNIPFSKFIIGVVLGLSIAFFSYALFQVFREILRANSVSDDFDIWLLTEGEVNFYNLIVAYIAIIIGQSCSFIYWFDVPKNNFKTRPTRLRSIVHEQRFLNWYFLNWFAKLSVVFGIIFGFQGAGWHYEFSFFPEYKYLFVLIIIVLFLQTWNSILLVFKKKAFKWMLISALAISAFSILLSKVNLVPYQELNSRVIANRINSKFQLRLPESTVFKNQKRRNHFPKVSLVFSKDSINTKPIYLLGNNVYTLKQLIIELDERNKSRNEYVRWAEVGFYFQIDKETPMLYVEQLKQKLGYLDFMYLHYLVLPKDRKLDDFYYHAIQYSYFRIYNNYHISNQNFKEKEFSTNLTLGYSEGKYVINEVPVLKENLKHQLQSHMRVDSNYVLNFYFDKNLTFGQYIKMHSLVWETVNELRDEYALDIYGKKFKDLQDIQTPYILRKFPFALREKFKNLPEEDH